ncbi:Crp/Fnr family transcriptional regulator [Streptomyces sp. NPDC058284]|uniref:Crp/Fnr family transcriptional regulator n=1 Tax=unclassified Streptomyces TaxID=2593676 RepID=UPI00364B5DAE
MSSTTTLSALPAEHRERLMRIARDASFPAGTRIFDEGGRADRFWIIRTGSVVLDMHVPGHRLTSIETLGRDELLGWSWLFPPYIWQLGAVAQSPVRAAEFDAPAVRLMCEDDPALGTVVGHWVGRVLAHRLRVARVRLLDLYAPDDREGGAGD